MAVDLEEEVRRLRAQAEQLDRVLGRIEAGDLTGGISMVVQTTTISSYPTVNAAGTTYAALPIDVTGGDSEGASGTLTAQSGHIFCVNLGPNLPTSSTYLIVHRVSNAWVFYY